MAICKLLNYLHLTAISGSVWGSLAALRGAINENLLEKLMLQRQIEVHEMTASCFSRCPSWAFPP